VHVVFCVSWGSERPVLRFVAGGRAVSFRRPPAPREPAAEATTILPTVNRAYAPQEVVDLAHARREARADRDWARADVLKAEIEAAGWTVVDRGVDFELRPAVPPDVIRDGVVHFGAAASVPSRLEEPASVDATVVAVVRDPATIAELVAAAGGLGPRVELVIVAEPSDDMPGPDVGDTDRVEVIRTASAFGVGAARNVGLRRCRGAIAVVIDASDAGEAGEAPLAQTLEWLAAGGLDRIERALDDAAVALVGVVAYASDDLRRFRPDGGGAADPVAVGGPVVAFRRADLVGRGPLDERFGSAVGLDVWWSLVLRDGGDGVPTRRAIALRDGPPSLMASSSSDDWRLPRRDAYRLAERFAGEDHLLVREAPAPPSD
jgi:hypothetical protein